MKIIFWVAPAYAVSSLDALVEAGHELVGVVTQPDRRRGPGKALVPSPVKARAIELGLPVFTPERIRKEPDCQQQLAALGADVYVVVAFGQILPKEILQQPPLGCWNGHGSLLPRWRGAGPIQWSLIEGDASPASGSWRWSRDSTPGRCCWSAPSRSAYVRTPTSWPSVWHALKPQISPSEEGLISLSGTPISGFLHHEQHRVDVCVH